MSKENLIQFFGSVSKKPELEKELNEAGNSADKWVAVGRSAGFEFTKGDLKDFISEALDKEVDEGSMLEAYLSSEALSEAELDQVAGGAGTTMTRTLSSRLGASLDQMGYFSGFGDQAVWYAPMGHDAVGQVGTTFKK